MISVTKRSEMTVAKPWDNPHLSKIGMTKLVPRRSEPRAAERKPQKVTPT